MYFVAYIVDFQSFLSQKADKLPDSILCVHIDVFGPSVRFAYLRDEGVQAPLFVCRSETLGKNLSDLKEPAVGQRRFHERVVTGVAVSDRHQGLHQI